MKKTIYKIQIPNEPLKFESKFKNPSKIEMRHMKV